MPFRDHLRVIAFWSASILLVAAGVLLAIFATPSREGAEPQRVQAQLTIAIAVQDDVFPALVYIAKDKGYFEQENIDVTLHAFPSGRMALRSVLAGEIDMATTTGVPIAWHTLRGADLTILCTLGFTDRAFRVVGRTEHGITQPRDLVGKKIGVPRASSEHLFLDVFLASHDVDGSDVQLVHMPAMDLPDALADGEIDALVMRHPFDGEGIMGIESAAVVFRGPDYYRAYFALVAAPELAVGDCDESAAVLRALVRAERLVRSDRGAALDAVARQLGDARRREVEHAWQDYRFEVAAAQSFIINLESEARWLLGRFPTLEGPVPDYFEMFQTDPLRRVRPESVTVWR